jgi:hypothetical protein
MTSSTKTNGRKLVALHELLAQPLPYEDVDVPEYGPGAQIRLNAVTGLKRAELAKLQAEDQTGPDRLEFQHELIAAALDDGSTPEQVSKLPSTVIDRLAAKALLLAGIGTAANDQAEKDLEPAQSSASG